MDASDSASSSSSSSNETVDPKALITATMMNDLRVVQKLLSNKNTDVDGADESGDTALHHACTKNLRPIAKQLLKANANPNKQNNTGSTPLHKAAMKADASVIRLLLESKADNSIANAAGFLPESLTRNERTKAVLLGEDAAVAEVAVPKAEHRRLIGKAGAHLRELEAETNTRIIIPNKEDNSDIVVIKGRASSVEKAKAIVLEFVGSKAQDNLSALDDDQPSSHECCLRLPLSKDRHRYISGKGARARRQIEEDLHVRIIVPTDDTDNIVQIQGSENNIDQALRRINELIAEEHSAARELANNRRRGDGRGRRGGERGRGGRGGSSGNGGNGGGRGGNSNGGERGRGNGRPRGDRRKTDGEAKKKTDGEAKKKTDGEAKKDTKKKSESKSDGATDTTATITTTTTTTDTEK